MTKGWATNAEFAFVAIAVFLCTFTAVRHPSVLFTASDLFFTLALALHLARGVVVKPFGDGTTFWMFGVILMIGGLMIGALFRGDPLRGMIVFIQYAYAYLVLPQLLLSRPYSRTIFLTKMAVLGMAANALTGVVAYFLGYSGGVARHYVLVTGGGRVTGLVDNPNGLAIQIVLTLPLLWLLMIRKAFRPGIGGLLFLFLVASLVLTSSNSGLLVGCIGGVVFLVGLGNIRVLAITATATVLLAFVVLQWGGDFLPATFQERVLTALETGDLSEAGTFQDRYDLMVEAWHLLPDNLVVGMGADQYQSYSSSGIKVHNLYLLLANEGGVMSFVGFGLILMGFVITAVAARNVPHPRLTRITMFTLATIFAVLAMGTTHLYNRALLVPLLLAAGLAVGNVRSRNRTVATRARAQQERLEHAS